jgi:hypothetical protein
MSDLFRVYEPYGSLGLSELERSLISAGSHHRAQILITMALVCATSEDWIPALLRHIDDEHNKNARIFAFSVSHLATAALIAAGTEATKRAAHDAIANWSEVDRDFLRDLLKQYHLIL